MAFKAREYFSRHTLNRRRFLAHSGTALAVIHAPALTAATTTEFKTARGPIPVKSAPDLVFAVPDQDKDLHIRVTYPDIEGPIPTIIFSHGALSSKDLYNRVVEHWASHGYATVLPTHLDSESLGYSFRNPLPREKVFFGRIGDLQFAVDRLDDIGRAAGIHGRLNVDNIAVAGHSFGVWIALIMAGLTVKMPNGEIKSFADPRFKALVSYNGIGQLPDIPVDGWSRVTLPVFAASGTSDPGATGSGPVQPWRSRMGAYDLTSSDEKYAVSITLGNHYYGGLICRENYMGPPDVEGLAIVNGMSTAFLDAYLKHDSDAKRFLQTADLTALTDNRGFLEHS